MENSTNDYNEMVEESINYDHVITVLGEFGVGKSSLINMLTNSNLKTSDNMDACTTFKSQLSSKYEYEINNKLKNMLFIDTPGFEKSNELHIKIQLYIIAIQLSMKYLNNIFIFVMKKSRFSEVNERLLIILDKTFGKPFWDNCILIFTNCDNEYLTIENNEKRNEKLDDWITIQSRNEKFTKLLGLFPKKFFLCTNNNYKNKQITSEIWTYQKELLFNYIKNLKQTINITQFKRLTRAISDGKEKVIEDEVNSLYGNLMDSWMIYVPIINIFYNIYAYDKKKEGRKVVENDFRINRQLVDVEKMVKKQQEEEVEIFEELKKMNSKTNNKVKEKKIKKNKENKKLDNNEQKEERNKNRSDNFDFLNK